MAKKHLLFAARLKELRAASGQTQLQLAENAGVPVSTVRGYENGQREPSLSNLLRLARALGVSLAAFEMEIEEEKPKPKRRKKKPPK